MTKYGINFLDNTNSTMQLMGREGAIRTIDYFTTLAYNDIPGHSVLTGFGQRSGLSTTINGDDVWEGTETTCPIPNQSTGESMSVVSTSTSDSVSGTGIRTLYVRYLNSVGTMLSSVVTMNGTTPVTLSGINIRFVQYIHSSTVGTNETAVGTVSIYRTISSSRVYNIIRPGGNMSLNSSRMVPLGKAFHLKSLTLTAASNKTVSLRLRTTSYNGTVTPSYFFIFKDVAYLTDSVIQKEYYTPTIIPALTVVKVTAYSQLTQGSVSASYEGWIRSV